MDCSLPHSPDDRSVQRQLQESLDRFRTLTENAFDLIAEVDEHAVYRYLSPNHTEVLGWDIPQTLGRCAFEYIHPAQHEFARQALQEAIRDGSAVVQLQIRTASGEWRWIETAGQSYRTADGELRFVVISRDVTARRLAEERLLREREFQRRLVALLDADRRLMAYEIHDGLVQDLYGAQLFLEAIQAAESLSDDARPLFEAATQLIRGAIEQARRLINGLRPPILDEQGLLAALEHLAYDMEHTWQLQVDFRADVRFERLSPTVENAVYRIVQECLNNVQRHSSADRAIVALTERDGHLEIVVEDAGQGFDLEAVSEKRYGLAGIRERARLLGGEARIESRPGAGTRVTVRLPLSDPEAMVC